MNTLISSLRGFTFNGKHNNDIKVVMHSKSIQPPSKTKIKASVPFMSGEYDFSTIGSGGEVIYQNREITITIGMNADSKESLQVIYSNVLEWILNVNGSRLIFDDSKDYYYVADVESSSTFEEFMSFGKLTIKFTAEPYKKGIDYATNPLWDTFNFEEDYLQDSDYDVTASRIIEIYNPKMVVAPVINCNSTMSVTHNNIVYNLSVGDNKPYGFKLQNGLNTLTFSGTGHVKISFRKVSL